SPFSDSGENNFSRIWAGTWVDPVIDEPNSSSKESLAQNNQLSGYKFIKKEMFGGSPGSVRKVLL
ncbi:MAG: hypothetical protein ACKO96_03630, partial [Flammeovirgaceae bacterium]